MNAATLARLDAAAAHLDAAADLAQADPAPRGAVLAAMIRLVRAGVSPGMPGDARSRETAASVREHLLTALEHLDDVEPLDGPPELVVWAWHLHELIDVATRRTGRS